MPQPSKSKLLTEQGKGEGLSPHSAMRLDTLAGVRSEMARLYRKSLVGKLAPDKMTKFVYVLKEIRGCLESELLENVQARLAALTSKVEARRYGH